VAGQTWGYKGDVDAVSVVHVWKVVALVVGMSALAVVTGFVLPHDRPADWSLVAIGMAVVAVLLAVLAVVAVRTVRQGAGATPPAAVAFGIAFGFLVALVPLTAGLSGAHALYRCILFSPAVAVSTFGSRRAVAAFAVLTMVALVVTSMVQGLALDAVPALVVSYGLGWGSVLLIVHMNHEDTVTDLDHQKCLAELSAIVATAATVDHGLQAMAPILGDLLDAESVEIRRFAPALRADGEVVASWSHGAAPAGAADVERVDRVDRVDRGADAVSPARLRDSLATLAPEIDEADIVFGVAGDGEAPCGLAVGIRRRQARFEARMTVRHRAEQARADLATLLRRLDVLDRLEARSTTDSLTDLANRRALFDRLVREREGARRDGRTLVVAMLDVDHFKAFNDAFGHLAGDAVLVELARLLERRLRAGDLAARFGGEEFCLVLSGTTAAEAERVVADVHDGCRLIAADRDITFSAGIAQWVPEEEVDELLARADRALYAAKAAGRDRTVVAPPTAAALDRRTIAPAVNPTL